LNTVNVGAKVTLGGRVFHARANITWNERSPIVQSRARSMISRWRELEHTTMWQFCLVGPVQVMGRV